MKRILGIMILTISYLNAGTNAFILENDTLTGTDKHYTNGIFYTWMSENNDVSVPDLLDFGGDQDNLAISFSHLTFTPADLSDPKVITTDMPYAGYMNLTLLFYKSTKNYFHEFGAGFGAVGPIAQSDRLQKEIHDITGNRQPEGWNNQLRNDYLLNFSYQFGLKTNVIDIGDFNFDWLANIRFDAGDFYSGALLGTTMRFGNYLPNNFKTTGNFFGGEESALLNFDTPDYFGWSISFGIFGNTIKRFYVVDEYEEYQIGNVDYAKGGLFTLSLYLGYFEVDLKVRSTYINNENLEINEDNVKKWGGINLIWKFD